jgi:F420-non-reducing hydrogenase large subunit
MATARAEEEYERFYAALAPAGSWGAAHKPVVHHRLATHWARLIELLYAAERIVELTADPEITSDQVHTRPSETPSEGVGTVEAPRGLLTHHYWTDERGVLTRVNLIVGTTNNYAPISMSIAKAARAFIRPGIPVTEGLLNRIEMAFRAYDPCLGCATHSLPGRMPLEVTIRDAAGRPVEVLRQHCGN